MKNQWRCAVPVLLDVGSKIFVPHDDEFIRRAPTDADLEEQEEDEQGEACLPGTLDEAEPS